MAHQYLSPEQAAERLSCSRAAVLRAIYAQQLPAVKLSSRTIRIKVDDVDVWGWEKEVVLTTP